MLFLLAVSMGCTFLITFSYLHLRNEYKKEYYADVPAPTFSCDYNIRRLSGYNYIKPLLYVDKNCESGAFIPMKQQVEYIINAAKISGKLSSASVYARDFNEGDFMAINEDEKYKSSALMNVPLMITYLHMDEDNEGYLDKEVLFSHATAETTSILRKGERIEVGNKYSLKKLLEYMVVNRDEEATRLLYENIDKKAFKKTFTDLGFAAPENLSEASTISAEDFSLFMRTLYNATYLTINNSEYATKLLCSSETLNRTDETGIPSYVKMARDFAVTNDSTEKELHESSIIYVNNFPYNITIMTKGNDSKQLSKVINQISAIVYKGILSKSISPNNTIAK